MESCTKTENILLEKSNTVERSSTKLNTYYQRVRRIIETVKKLGRRKPRKEGAGFLNEVFGKIFEFLKPGMQILPQFLLLFFLHLLN